MSDDPIEMNDNSVAHGDDLTSSASAQGAEVRPRPVRAAGGRFRAGQLGNPRGRPRKAPEPFFEMVARVLERASLAHAQGAARRDILCRGDHTRDVPWGDEGSAPGQGGPQIRGCT